MATTRERLHTALSEADFPAERAELVRYAERAERRRTHDKPGLSEQAKDVEAHPIVEELGENRGS